MFTNLIGTLTSLLPKNFIFSAYVPVLIFGFLNLTLLYALYPPFHAFAAAQLPAPFTLTTAVLFVASLVIAYILSSITDFLREFLEGKYVWPPIVESLLRSRQHRLLENCDKAYERARFIAVNLNATQETKWQDQLREAFNAGSHAHPGAVGYSRRTDRGGVLFSKLRKLIIGERTFSFDDVRAAVDAMSNSLRRYDIVADAQLAADHLELLNLISYARTAAEDRELRAFTVRQTRFGTVAEPTGMGNVAASISSYATSRYGIDLDMFWSRVQSLLQNGKDKSYDALLDAKTQLDFLVACCCLSGITTLVWMVLLATFGDEWPTFVEIAVVGPAVTAAVYLLAVTNYLSYGELIRATVDLNRFALLRSLRVRQPAGLREERLLWEGLRELSSFGSTGIELSYEPEKP